MHLFLDCSVRCINIHIKPSLMNLVFYLLKSEHKIIRCPQLLELGNGRNEEYLLLVSSWESKNPGGDVVIYTSNCNYLLFRRKNTVKGLDALE